MSTTSFHDHFSSVAKRYADFRPHYPAGLFDYLATVVPASSVVWDCAAGNGQATFDLAERFERVVATDASAALGRPKCPASYHVAPVAPRWPHILRPWRPPTRGDPFARKIRHNVTFAVLLGNSQKHPSHDPSRDASKRHKIFWFGSGRDFRIWGNVLPKMYDKQTPQLPLSESTVRLS